MAVTSGSRLQFEFMLGGGSPPIFQYLCHADASGWDAGSLLHIDASGHVGTVATGALTTGHLVFALDPLVACTADGSESVLGILVTRNQVYSGIVAHATTASAVVQTSQVGKRYEISSSATVCPSTNVHVIDLGESGSGAIGAYIVANKDATGTAYGRDYFIFTHCWSSNSPFFMTTA
jgi:hypothetical protein